MAEKNEFKFFIPEELKRKDKFNMKTEKDNGLNIPTFSIDSYSKLVELVGYLSFYNKNYVLLYRGQKQRHHYNGKLSFLPTIYRKNGEELTNESLQERFRSLRQLTEQINKLPELQKVFTAIDDSDKEIVLQSIIQHYHSEFKKSIPNIGTPFLDFTQSLRVAYSFAGLDDKYKPTKANGHVYVYIFGFPYLPKYIWSENNMTIIRLLSICPALALRPFFQEGYLASKGKITDCKDIEKCDFNRQLIAEVEIPINDITNNKYFHRIPPESLDELTLDPLIQILQSRK